MKKPNHPPTRICKRGHVVDGATSTVNNKGYTICGICLKASQDKWHEKQKSKKQHNDDTIPDLLKDQTEEVITKAVLMFLDEGWIITPELLQKIILAATNSLTEQAK